MKCKNNQTMKEFLKKQWNSLLYKLMFKKKKE